MAAIHSETGISEEITCESHCSEPSVSSKSTFLASEMLNWLAHQNECKTDTETSVVEVLLKALDIRLNDADDLDRFSTSLQRSGEYPIFSKYVTLTRLVDNHWQDSILTRLPTDLAIQSLSYLDMHDLIHARESCKQLSWPVEFCVGRLTTLHMFSAVWETVEQADYVMFSNTFENITTFIGTSHWEQPDSFFPTLLRRCPRLTTIRKSVVQDCVFSELSIKFPNLTHLCSIRIFDEDQTVNILPTLLPSLRILRLCGIYVPGYVMASALQEWTLLESLKLTVGACEVSAEMVSGVIDLPVLTKLHIHGGVDIAATRLLGGHLKSCVKDLTFGLSRLCEFTNADVRSLASKWSKLESLHIIKESLMPMGIFVCSPITLTVQPFLSLQYLNIEPPLPRVVLCRLTEHTFPKLKRCLIKIADSLLIMSPVRLAMPKLNHLQINGISIVDTTSHLLFHSNGEPSFGSLDSLSIGLESLDASVSTYQLAWYLSSLKSLELLRVTEQHAHLFSLPRSRLRWKGWMEDSGFGRMRKLVFRENVSPRICAKLARHRWESLESLTIGFSEQCTRPKVRALPTAFPILCSLRLFGCVVAVHLLLVPEEFSRLKKVHCSEELRALAMVKGSDHIDVCWVTSPPSYEFK
eukprot:218653_1